MSPNGSSTPRDTPQQSHTHNSLPSRRSLRMQAALQAEAELLAEQAVATSVAHADEAPVVSRRRDRRSAQVIENTVEQVAESTTVFPPAAALDAEPQPVIIHEISMPTPAWAESKAPAPEKVASAATQAASEQKRTEPPVLVSDSHAVLAAAFIAPATASHPPRATSRRLSADTALNSVVSATSVAQPTPTLMPGERKSRWSNLRSTGIVALAVPGLLATIALPAYAFAPTDGAVADANNQIVSQAAKGQSFTVSDDVTLGQLERDGYSATSSEELDAQYASSTYVFDGTATMAAYLAPSSSGWWRPLPGEITSKYGPRGLICNSVGCSNSFHEGMDFGGACGTPIKATAPGRVTFVGNAGAYGNRVIIDHGDGVETIYGHLLSGSFEVAVGDTVAGGDFIAEVGATGVVSGCHLDLKVNEDGEHTNPAPFLREKGVVV
ncbi:peptidoglycan DD-metalloendopeptidase family protein [Mycetocola zhadangensis]|nr:peptidoglycan DD-metalloendopeptidase family protein [Mycetocola zhadangensis]